MKKFLLAILILILILSLVGCGNQRSVTVYNDTPAQEINDETVQYIQEQTEEPTDHRQNLPMLI